VDSFALARHHAAEHAQVEHWYCYDIIRRTICGVAPPCVQAGRQCRRVQCCLSPGPPTVL